MAQRLNVGGMKPMRMSIQLADRSVRLPLGVLEDVPVQVGRVFLPCDFVIMEMEEDSRSDLGALVLENGRCGYRCEGR